MISLASIILSACSGVSAQYYPLSNAISTRAARHSSEVEVFITKKPEYKYDEMGMITYETPSSYSNEPKVYNVMREKAAEIGADAIIIMDSQSSIENMNRIVMDYYGNPIESSSPRAYIKYRAMAILKK